MHELFNLAIWMKRRPIGLKQQPTRDQLYSLSNMQRMKDCVFEAMSIHNVYNVDHPLAFYSRCMSSATV